jgi:uncharacterized membrane protein|tara:strand:+ start:144 stop:356 length:213 start_codon:yes stop_codon:yes gene_type:complete
MEKQTLKFTIRQDGTVTEEVIGVVGNECQEITAAVEKKLGNVTYVETKPEFYQQQNTQKDVTLQHNQNED